MVRKFLEGLVVPGAIATMVFAGALATGGAAAPSAYDGTLNRLEAADFGAHAGAIFARADLDGDGFLDAREYEALAIVTAELARLNGFVAVLGEGKVNKVEIPNGPLLTLGERARVGALASRRFHVAARGGAHLDRDAFIADRLENFEAADRDRNGVLTGSELAAYGALEAGRQVSNV